MPKGEYFGGRGAEVYRKMKKQYGAKAEEVFYATAKKQKMEPDTGSKRGLKKAMK